MICNGNCNQGRSCDCVPDLPVQFAEPEPKDPNDFDGTVISALVILVAVFVVGYYVGKMAGGAA